jgi:hypothetical protein
MSGCIGNNTDINTVFIIEPLSITGGSDVISACTALFTNEVISCSGDTSIVMGTGQIVINKDLTPSNSNVRVGTTTNRFRELNTLSGSSSYWSSTTALIPTLSATTIDLGLDGLGNERVLTADSSVLVNDILNPGYY